MKKLTLTLGVISSFLLVIAVLVKSQHWPGASMAMVISIALFALGYAPTLFMDKNMLTQDKSQKSVNLMTLLAMIIIPITVLFKFQHWEYAQIGIYLGHLVVLAMIIIMFMHASKETDPAKKLNFYNEAIILVMLFAFSLYLWLVHPHPPVTP